MTIEIDADLYVAINRYLSIEARILDERRFEDWLELLTEDVSYRMPLRVTRELKDGNAPAETSYFEDDYTTLTSRLARLGTTSAWSEDPPTRTRHFITNIVIDPGDAENEIAVSSNLALTRNRADSPENDLITATREDVLRLVDGKWKIARRVVFIDQAVLGTHNLTTMY